MHEDSNPVRTRLAWCIALVLFLLAAPVASARDVPAFSGVEFVEAWPDVAFAEPMHVTQPKDGKNTIYVCEQRGRIQAIRKYEGKGPVPKPRLFLDIQSKVHARAQGGLLAMAFHPQFASNQLFYVSYLAKNSRPGPHGAKFRLVIAEYRSLGEKADPSTARTVLEIHKANAQHQAGGIAFGPDGMLYISVGDGHSGILRSLLGKVLRIDPSKRQGGKGYGIPADNPFRQGGIPAEIWARGFRNPWRFCWGPDRRMYTVEPGTTGPDSREWVIEVRKGGSHGWPWFEGTRRVKQPPPGIRFVRPLFEWVRGKAPSTCGICGFVYRGQKIKALRGKLVFGDYSRGEAYCIDLGEAPDPVSPGGRRATGSNQRVLGDVPDLASFGEDVEGEIYACAVEMGVVLKLVPSGR